MPRLRITLGVIVFCAACWSAIWALAVRPALSALAGLIFGGPPA